MKIAITGAAGQLGRDLLAELGPRHECHGLTRIEADITDYAALGRCLERLQPELVIHAAAYTDVDGCERDPDRAYRENAIGTWNVAAAAQACSAAVAVIRPDFVFDGGNQAPYTAFDP